jgi:hypothetical protein
MLNGDVFSNQVFHNEIFALFINSFLDGHNGVINGFKNSMAMTTSGSGVTISTGAVVVQGRFMHEDSLNGTTKSVSATNKYHKLVIEIDLDKTNTALSFQQANYKILTGNSSYPSLTQTDIVNNVSGIYQYELARFQTDSSGNITNFQDKREFLDFDSIYTAIENTLATMQTDFESEADTLIADLQQEIANVEDTSEFIMKSTIKTLSKSVTPVQSGGQYDVNVTFNLPSGYNFGNVIILRVELYEDSGGVGDFRTLRGDYKTFAQEPSETNLQLYFNDVSSDTNEVKITFMRV